MYITHPAQLHDLMIPHAEEPRLAIVRPTTHFQIVTGDNPDMDRTLATMYTEIRDRLVTSQEALPIAHLILEYQAVLSAHAFQEQCGLIRSMRHHGIPLRYMMEDKTSTLESTTTLDYYTDQIFATDVGQYYDDEGQLCFVPAHFKNKQRQGEERLAIAQAQGFGAKIKFLQDTQDALVTFEGGDTRQMLGKKLFFIGQGHRSDAQTAPLFAQMTGYHVIPIRLMQEQFYHVDCCFLPLPQDAAVIYEGEYVYDTEGQLMFDDHGWPRLEPGTETMDDVSRQLVRGLYPPARLVLLSKAEALAYATNAAIIKSSDGRFKMFVNGGAATFYADEQAALLAHAISYTRANLNHIMALTGDCMDVVEVPYATMHKSGGSVRCTVQEVACSSSALRLRSADTSTLGIKPSMSPHGTFSKSASSADLTSLTHKKTFGSGHA